MNASPAILDNGGEEKETVSLCNSPVAQSSKPATKFASEPSDMFEFFNNLSSSSDSNMSHAEDIIFCGKLIPLKQNLHSDREKEKQSSCNRINMTEEEKEKELEKSNFRYRKRTETSSELKYATQPNSPKSSRHMMRISKSLDYQQLRRSLSFDSRSAGIRRYSSTKSSGRDDSSAQKVCKPRWYSMLFGLVSKTPPPEMELRDMKSRLVRRTPSTMFPPLDGDPNFQAIQTHRKSSWRFLSVLSCKDSTSVGVTTSFGYMPHDNQCDRPLSRAACS